MSVHPVAHGGMDANIGAKNMEMMKQIPQAMAVKPVLPPSAMPAPDSITTQHQYAKKGKKRGHMVLTDCDRRHTKESSHGDTKSIRAISKR